MPSRTPETLTAVQRAHRLNLHPSGKKVEADLPPLEPPMSPAKAPSKQEQQAIAQGRATLPTISGKRSATADLDPRDDPDMSFMALPIDQIEPYKNNPRTGANPNYEQIKASIKADGITNMLTVTRRDKHGKFTTYGGGNTRLRIAKELFAEGDQRFGTLHVVFKEWPGDAQVITAHLVENENRADITFWEKAQGVQMFKTEFERENGKPLTVGELNRELRQRGLNYGIRTLQNFAFAVEHLLPVGEWLKPREVNEMLRPHVASLSDIGTKLGVGTAMRQHMAEVMVKHAEFIRNIVKENNDREPDERLPVALDHARLATELDHAVAEMLEIEVTQLDAMRVALATDPRVSAEALRNSQVSPTPLSSALTPTDTVPRLSSPAITPPSGPTEPPTAAPIRPQTPSKQSPLPGMLAGVPASKPPETPPVPDMSKPDPGGFEQLSQSIRTTLEALNTDTLPLYDVLIATPHAPFGFLADLPDQDLAHVQGTALRPEVAELRAAVWRVLAAVSGQCDQRIAQRFTNDPSCHWGQLLARGKETFQTTCELKTGLRLQGGDLVWGMGDLARVLADPATGYTFIKLFMCMEQVRLHQPERFPAGYMPLFATEVGDGSAI